MLPVTAGISEAESPLGQSKLKDERAQLVCPHERIMKAQVCRDSSTISCVVSKKTTEENPARSITTELKRRPFVDKSDKTVMDVHLNEPTQLARHIHQRIQLGLTIEARQRNVHVHGVEQD